MAHTTKALVSWMSAVIIITITVFYITWLIVIKQETKVTIGIINGISVGQMLRFPASTAYCLFTADKHSAEDGHLAWVEEETPKNFSLDESKTGIMVKEEGVYLVYVQLTYGLKKDENSSASEVELNLRVVLNVTEGKEELSGAFDTRELHEKEEDAHLSAFLVLPMKPGNRLSVLAEPTKRIKYNDVRPFSNYITIIRYAE